MMSSRSPLDRFCRAGTAVATCWYFFVARPGFVVADFVSPVGVPGRPHGQHHGRLRRPDAAEAEKGAAENKSAKDPWAMPYNHIAKDPKTQKFRFAWKDKSPNYDRTRTGTTTTENKAESDNIKDFNRQGKETTRQQASFLQKAQRAGVQLKAETKTRTTSSLFPIKLNFDVEQLPSSLLMVWDADEASLRLDVSGRGGRGIAEATFTDSIEYQGWAHFNVSTNADMPGVDEDVKMYSAGYIEGLLTSVRISEFYANHHKLLLESEKANHALLNIKTVLQNEIAAVREQSVFEDHVLPEEPPDAYSRQIRYMLFQLWGMLDGYNHMATHYYIHKLNMVDLLLLNSLAELQQMMKAYSPRAILDRTEAIGAGALVFLQKEKKEQAKQRTRTGAQSSVGNKEPHQEMEVQPGNKATEKVAPVVQQEGQREDLLDDAHWERRLAEDGHCTAYVRITDTDMLVGHATWGDYAQMLRVYKYYDFALPGGDTSARKIAMSSYPGLISSGDDHYLTDTGLVIMDTSLEVLDSTLYDKVDDKPTVPGFMHLMAVNRLARTGADWASRYQTRNAGTRNAQWLVVSYQQYSPGQSPLAPGTLWMVETVPGATEAHDVSATLSEKKFIGSVNRPVFAQMREKTGFAAAEKSHGDLYSATNAPRMKILTAAAPGSLLDMRGLLVENKWGAWPGPTSPGHDVAARMDLARQNPIPNGAIDAKLVNHCLARVMSVQAKSGPTTAGQPPFRWQRKDGSEVFPGVAHYGLPNVWAFPWMQVTSAGLDVGLTDIDDCPDSAFAQS
ncbi:unnamed protein product [Amoebophrya sp. A120]|nr:unnamed protein product [Amoebophrya sp. A120]|eukprot:GSA120T00018394001.1